MSVKLNLGCGEKYLEGFINIDNGACKSDYNIDFEVEDLSKFQFTQVVDYILAENLFPMVKNTKFLLNGCHRTLEKAGVLEMLNFDAGKRPELFFQDPQHEKGFTEETYSYFVKSEEHYKQFGKVYGYLPWELLSIKKEGVCLRILLTPVKDI